MESSTYLTTVVGLDNNSTNVTEHRNKNKLAYVHFVIGTYIFIANSLVIIAVVKHHYLRNRANMYIVSLAGTDVCVGIMEWIVGLHNHEILEKWFDETGPACVGMFSFAFFSVACSMFNMVLIALDRLVYIMKPFFYGRVVTSTKVKIVIAFVWLLALAWGSIPLLTNTYDPNVATCTMQLAIPTWFRAYANVPVLFSGAIATGIIYIIIAVKAIEHKQAIFKSNPGFSKMTGDTSQLSEAAKNAVQNLRSNLKTLKLFCIVFGLLIFCWFPYYIIEFTSEFVKIKDAYYRASTALGFLNSGINFIVYPLYNKKFRRALKSMVCPCLVDPNRPPSDTSYATSTVSKKTTSNKPNTASSPQGPPRPMLGTFKSEPHLDTLAEEPLPPKTTVISFSPGWKISQDLLKSESLELPVTPDLAVTELVVPTVPELPGDESSHLPATKASDKKETLPVPSLAKSVPDIGAAAAPSQERLVPVLSLAFVRRLFQSEMTLSSISKASVSREVGSRVDLPREATLQSEGSSTDMVVINIKESSSSTAHN